MTNVFVVGVNRKKMLRPTLVLSKTFSLTVEKASKHGGMEQETLMVLQAILTVPAVLTSV